MLLNTRLATLWNAAISSQEVGRCLLALPTWEGGMRKTSKGGVWFWGRLQRAQSGMGGNLFPWAALNQTQVAKSILKMCYGLLRCLELGVWSALCSQLWDELRACAFSELKFKRVSKLEIWASKHDAGLEHEIARFASLPCSGLLLSTFLPMQYLWSDATALGDMEVLKIKSLLHRCLLHLSCFDFRLYSTSGSMQSWLCRWTSQLCLFTQRSIIYARKRCNYFHK